VAGFCSLVLWGLGWGIPSQRRAELDGSLGRPPRVPPELLEESWRHWGSRGRHSELATAFRRHLFNPIRSYHPDEYQLFKSLSHMNPGRIQFDPGNYIYPTLHTYLVGAAVGACSVLGVVRLERNLDYYFDHPEQMGRMYLIGRVLSLLAAVGALLLVWRIGERMQRGVGLLAMALLAAMPALGIHSHNMTRDTCAALAAVLLFACCRKLVATGAGKWYDLAGAAAGLCVGFQYFAVVLWGLVPLAALLGRRRARAAGSVESSSSSCSSSSSNLSSQEPGEGPKPGSRTRTRTRTIEDQEPRSRNQNSARVVVGRLAASFLVMVTVFALACPYQVLNLSQFLADFGSETGHVGSGGVLDRLVSFGWATHLVRMMPAMVTWPMALVAWAGMVLALARRRDDDLLLLIWLALWAGVVGFDGRSYSRYYVPLLPALALFAARGLAWAWGKWVPRPVVGRFPSSSCSSSSSCSTPPSEPAGQASKPRSRTRTRTRTIEDPEAKSTAPISARVEGRGMPRPYLGVRLRVAAAVVALAAVLGPAAAMSSAWARLYSLENVRTLAGAWIADSLPARASIGMTKWPWQFEMPPVNPARYRLVVLEDSAEHSPYDWPRLMQLKPDYFVTSSLQYGNIDLAARPPVLELRGAPRAEAFWEVVLKSDTTYRPLRSFEVPLALFGRRIETRGCPEDMQYVNPCIDVLELIESQAGRPGQESPSVHTGRARHEPTDHHASDRLWDG